jgi:hypothetical protein
MYFWQILVYINIEAKYVYVNFGKKVKNKPVSVDLRL